MTDLRTPGADEVEEVAHLALLAGRLLLANGADTAQVETSVTRLAAAFDCETHLMVGDGSILMTLVAAGHFRTKIGHRLPGMNVSLSTIDAVNRLVDDAEAGAIGLPGMRLALEAVEHQPPAYSRWLVVAALGLTAASLSRLFGGDWPTFAIAWVAGAAGTWLRQELGRRGGNAIAIPFAAACLSGLIGGAGVSLGLSGTPALCLVAPGMIIVPGVPLINGVHDMIRNRMTLGINRLAFASLVIAAITLGLLVASLVTGAEIPIDPPARAIGLMQDALFSALAATGFALLFSVPARIAWACVVCGVASHTTRTLCVHLGLDIVGGTLIGALIAGVLAQGFGRLYRAPAVAFAFPGVVAMVPGAYAFSTVLGALQIEHRTASPHVTQETLALGIEVVMMVGAIALGVVLPAMLGMHPRPRATRTRR